MLFKIWDGQLKYPRENDDVATQQTKFIPVVINGGYDLLVESKINGTMKFSKA
jgi:hypothetical protein